MKYNGIIQRKLSLLDDQVVLLQKHLATTRLGDFRKFRDEIDRC